MTRQSIPGVKTPDGGPAVQERLPVSGMPVLRQHLGLSRVGSVAPNGDLRALL